VCNYLYRYKEKSGFPYDDTRASSIQRYLNVSQSYENYFDLILFVSLLLFVLDVFVPDNL